MSRLLALGRKELIQLRRDRLTLAMTVAFPVIQLLLFGYAINTDVRHIPIVIYDQDHSVLSRDVVRSMEATGFYDVVGHVRSFEEIARALRQGSARSALVIPAGFGRSAEHGSGSQLQLVLDGSDPQTVASALGAATGVAADRASTLAAARLAASGPAAPRLVPIALEPTTWYNPELRTAVYVVPGIIGVILTMTMVMLTAMAIARERERGTLEALIVSPVRPIEIIVGKIAPYVVIGYIQMTLILLVGRVVFEVPFAGSVALLYGLAFLFIAANLSLGLFFSTLAKTQQQAMQMSFFFLLPNILLSGFAFPWEGMPRAAQWLSQMLPLTHFLRIVRGITLKGASFDDVRVDVVWLVGLLVALVAVASLRFRKKLV